MYQPADRIAAVTITMVVVMEVQYTQRFFAAERASVPDADFGNQPL